MTPHTSSPDRIDLPGIGLGTYGLDGRDGVAAMVSALEMGYRLVDTAVNYGNEEEVGEALREAAVDRDEVVVCSKIPGRHHAHDDAIASTRASLDRLGLDRLDLHLIHWPNPSVGLYREAWQALVDLREQGLVRDIGVSNFTAQHLREIIDDTGVVPLVNQVELHPYFPQQDLRAVHDELGIRTEAWSPLAKRAVFDEPPIREAADSHGVTPAQVVLRWHLHLGVLPIPKSGSPERQAENLAVGDFSLTDDEVAAITALGRQDGRLFDGDPRTHEES
ncbi:aldo/keto reductase [Salsipaludibacter albus]|uniref:aldo/keto reductase n=1 Tax=Salsipaludibacter albus TaxID=2849650 RepID=UPI001EE4B26C|nr:aldo/keto reductase [Salsipaludibacter albus]MBY5161912.1 aldo/keto reductase [Salsipaludibacter albus]